MRLASVPGIFALFLLLLTGCETPEQTALLGGLLAGNAAVAGSAQQAASYAVAAQTAGSVAQIQSQQRAAEAGRTQIYVNNSPGTSDNNTRYANAEKMSDGSTYTGGMLKRTDGAWTPHGEGTMNYANGVLYSGGWSSGRWHGFGKLTGSDGLATQGQFEHGEAKSGERQLGTNSLGEKISFKGQFLEGGFLGPGVVTLSNPRGATLESEVQPDLEGTRGIWRVVYTKGTRFGPDGTEYSGEWRENTGLGDGIVLSPDGTKYIGKWRVLNRILDSFEQRKEMAQPHGVGTMTWSDGRKYTGGFRDGKIHGAGKMTYADGKTEDGVWREDKFVGAQASPDASIQSVSLKFGSVSIAAEDESFEVFVNGAFVGNSPAKLKLAEGAHVIEVKKAGFKDYKKEIKVSDGSELNLRAVLEKN